MSDKCLIPECGRPHALRGLCRQCYQIAAIRVRNGLATWEELEELGLAAKKNNRANKFAKALENARNLQKSKKR